MLETTLVIIALFLGVAGIIGSVVPALPGPPLGYAGLLVLHFSRDGGVYSNTLLVVLGLLTVVAVVMDYVLPMIGAKAYGASRQGIIGSVIGTVIGLMFFALIGMMIGMFLGAVFGEYMAGKKTGQAMKAGTASILGGVAAAAVKLSLSIAFLVYVIANISA